ncbi:RNA-directed DNA polymerase, eukaryota [Tanacetum coccineum]
MGSYRSKEDEVKKISTSVFVTNFPDEMCAKDLWHTEVSGWIPDFVDEEEDENDSDGEFKEDGLYDENDLLKKKQGNVNEDTNSNDTMKYPPGFTPKATDEVHSNDFKEVETEADECLQNIQDDIANSEVGKTCHKSNSKEDKEESICSGHFKKFELPHTGGSMLQLMEDLVKDQIRVWVKDKKEYAYKQKKTLKEKLADIDLLLDKGKGDSDVINQRDAIFKSLQDIEKQSRSLVKREFLSHFSNRFDQPGTSCVLLNMEFPNKLNLDQQIDLESDVTRDKIKRAIWDYGIDKSPGLDDGVVGSEVVLDLQEDRLLLMVVQLTNFNFRGLKRGDPLSPFLFILVMESLHISVQRVVDADMFKGISLGSSLHLSHLFYADDAVFLGQWRSSNVDIIIQVLECFYRASGLRINMSKSKLMGISVPDSMVDHRSINVAEKMSHENLSFSLRRDPRGGIEQEQFGQLLTNVEGTVLSNMCDRWVWSKEGSGEFSVASVRRMIDDRWLPNVSAKTRWTSVVPIKINVHTWKVRLNCLPTRLNISRRGMDIDSILCHSCGVTIETTSHVFFSCHIAREVFHKISNWWEVNFMELSLYEEWLE